MKRLLCGLILGSGMVVSGAAAQEVQWRPVPDRARQAPTHTSRGPLVVTLGTPSPLDLPPTPTLRPVGYQAPAVPDPAPATVTPSPAADASAAEGRRVWGSFASDRGDDVFVPDVIPPVPYDPDGSFGPAAGPAIPWVYFSGEYLLWWIKNSQFPPLITTGPVASGGILGQPGTQVLFGGNNIDAQERSGGRFTLGFWLDPEHCKAIETSMFFLGERSVRFAASSAEFPVLARPFFEVNGGRESAEQATTPNQAVGSLSVDAPSRLWGIESNLRCKLCCGCLGRLDLLTGFRYLQLDEGLRITESLQALPTAPAFANSRIRVWDSFDTRNQFYGGQIGLGTELRRGPWSLELRGKVALGVTHQTLDVSGNQVILAPTGQVSVFNGGLLALSSNSGHFSRDRFAVVPEASVTVGYQVTDWWRVFVGYNFLYWSSVLRPADQIDRALDINQIPNFARTGSPAGLTRPAVLLRDTDFWTQGISFGMEFRY